MTSDAPENSGFNEQDPVCLCEKELATSVIYLVLAAVIVPESLEYRKDSFLGFWFRCCFTRIAHSPW